MKIRAGQLQDVPSLVALDSSAYGDYGADRSYFEQKLHSARTKVIVTETENIITGFAVMEVMKPGQQLVDFSDLETYTQLTENWMHIIAFTSETNFRNIQADSKLLHAVETEGVKFGCTLFCVPLSVDHPYRKNDVFGFWEKNGYRNTGTIKWIADSTQTIDCYFYTKRAVNII